MLVKNMTSDKGNKIANQFIINSPEKTAVFFQSYDSMICKNSLGEITLDEYYWNYSRTTLKYLAQFLRHTTGQAINGKADIQKMIDSGEYKLANLN